jgi:hypothetical protein
MKNINLLVYLVISLIFNYSCSIIKSKKTVRINLECNEKMACTDLFNCSKILLKKGKYQHSFSDSVSSRQLLLCASQMASDGNNEAHKYLIEFFKVMKLNYKTNTDRYKNNPAIFAETKVSPMVIAFSKLRGTDAFELALEYINKCVCRPFVPNSDETYPSEETSTIIDFVISPMIKSIDDQKWLSSYFSKMSIDRFQDSFSKFSPEERHALQYNALIKAYKDGKIVLKKYGEE